MLYHTDIIIHVITLMRRLLLPPCRYAFLSPLMICLYYAAFRAATLRAIVSAPSTALRHAAAPFFAAVDSAIRHVSLRRCVIAIIADCRDMLCCYMLLRYCHAYGAMPLLRCHAMPLRYYVFLMFADSVIAAMLLPPPLYAITLSVDYAIAARLDAIMPRLPPDDDASVATPCYAARRFLLSFSPLMYSAIIFR